MAHFLREPARPLQADPARGRLAHVPALDGLRGAAVVGVLAFHAGHLRGGYLGVDLFFTLSGFLITSLLLVEWDTEGHIDLGAFWGRRFRRLLPALLVLLVAVAVYGAIELPTTDLAALREDGLATLLYVANWASIRGGSDYWAAFSSPSLLDHTWSLAIEEQFYVLWPLLAVVGLRATRGRRRALALGTAALVAGSIAALWLLHDPGEDTARAYFGTDTRAAAILYGALLALAVAGRQRASGHPLERAAAALSVPAAVALGVAWATMEGTGDDLYAWGLPLVGASAAIIVAAITGPCATPLRPLLAWRPLRWLGVCSYGLYLWHWPVYVVLDEDRLGGLHGYPLTAVRVAVSVALAVASLHLVERPIRSGRRVRRHWAVTAPAAGLAVAGVLVVATLGGTSQTGEVGEHVVTEPVVTVPELGSMLLLGDSQAVTLGRGAPAEVAGMQLAVDAVLGCGLGPGMSAPAGQPEAPAEEVVRCEAVVPEWVARITATRPDVVLLHAGAWEVLDRRIDGRLVAFGTGEWDQLTAAHLVSVLDQLEARGSVVVALTAPCFEPAPGGGPAERAERSRVDGWNRLLRAAGRVSGAIVLEYGALFCDADEGAPPRVDGVHLTEEGATAAWTWIERQLRTVLEIS